jgi:hypothetical protein
MNSWSRKVFTALGLAMWVSVGFMGSATLRAGSTEPFIYSTELKGEQVVISVHVPAGHMSTVLEISNDVASGWQPIVAGKLSGEEGLVTFTFPDNQPIRFMRVKANSSAELPEVPFSEAKHFSVEPGFYVFPEHKDGKVPPFGLNPVWSLGQAKKIGHLLNRIAYGPNLADVTKVEELGIEGYIESQLNPVTADWQRSPRQIQKEAELFYYHEPTIDEFHVEEGETWCYFKGTRQPPPNWKTMNFDDSLWEKGPSGFGYGDNDDMTKLTDMRFYEKTADDPGQPGYLSLFIRRSFQVRNLSEIKELIFRVDYDDGFIAYLNGREIARANLEGVARYNTKAKKGHEAGDPKDFEITDKLNLLKEGSNVLAIQVHNDKLTSNDLTMIPMLVQRTKLDSPPIKRIKNISSLQQLIHLRGIYSRRQLQAVVGEFWENHFTTDYDKLVEYIEDLENSDGRNAMSGKQAKQEAAQIEWQEYEFFHDNALGNFGDLLLHSATSPSMLIYLDNVLNEKKKPNENYAREILELFGFGVDNRYDQNDIEELAKAFTGWNVRKAWPADVKPFPSSARDPFTEESAQYEDDNKLKTGRVWRYFKGEKEPSPKKVGQDMIATLDWTLPGFNESKWSRGTVSIGYGDNDDKTTLGDMRNQYTSVYLRHTFAIEDPYGMDNLMLHVEYDDGFIAYLNGEEIGRSGTMNFTGSPPPFDAEANAGHEVTAKPMLINLKDHFQLFKKSPEQNVLAIQVHNTTKNSSDLSIRPTLIERKTLPGSIENGDPNGMWTFRFIPNQHHNDSKTLFKGTENQLRIRANQRGVNGVRDAISVIDKMVAHPSTSEFICQKLINKFVSDEISLTTYHSRTAPPELLTLMDRAIEAWHATKPAGDIDKVMRVILDPQSSFWRDIGYRGKIKTPIEYINSSIRALDGDVTGTNLPGYNSDLGMELFVRDDPDGYSEIGSDWMDTSTLLERMTFAQKMAGNADKYVNWEAETLFSERGPDTKIRYRIPPDGSLNLDWTKLNFNEASWSATGAGVGYDTNIGYTELIDLDVKTGMHQGNTSVYIRLPFLVDDPDQFDYLRLDMMYDDGFVAYLNGVKVAGANAPDTLAWNSKASEGHTDSEAVQYQSFSLSNHIRSLKKGKNILAIHGLNISNTSSDFLIRPRIRGGLGGGESIVNYFDRLLFQESLSGEQREILLNFVNSNMVGHPKKLDPASSTYLQQVQELVGLILSMPQWQFQ